jgi:hypothetical protein
MAPDLLLGGEGYQRILADNRFDAFLYRWSERTALIAGFGAMIMFFVTLLLPLTSFTHSDWPGFGQYLFKAALALLPFLLVFLAGAFVHRRVARKYGLLEQ